METLATAAQMSERDAFKNRAVEIRESGDLLTAEVMFGNVTAWDEANSNPRGQMDALGHLRITYTRMADQETDTLQKDSYRQMAKSTVEEAIAIGEKHPEISEGPKAIQKVHYASVLFDAGDYEHALIVVDDAINTLPGSIAHKAWPSNLKAKILAKLTQYEKALDAIQQGERWLYDGYEEEMAHDDQAEIKLNVWLSGLFLTRAAIYQETNRELLARHYAEAVLKMPDPKNVLGERRKEAQRLIETLVGVFVLSSLLYTTST